MFLFSSVCMLFLTLSLPRREKKNCAQQIVLIRNFVRFLSLMVSSTLNEIYCFVLLSIRIISEGVNHTEKRRNIETYTKKSFL